MEIDLDQHFRKDSRARKVAEKLLTGEPYTRQQLSQAANVSVTTVNRVVDVLEEQGVVVSRELDATDTRQAVFRVIRFGPPKRRVTFPSLGDEAQVRRAELIGESVVIDFGAHGRAYRGVLRDVSGRLPQLGDPTTVVGISLGSHGQAEVDLRGDDEEETWHVSGVENITD